MKPKPGPPISPQPLCDHRKAGNARRCQRLFNQPATLLQFSIMPNHLCNPDPCEAENTVHAFMVKKTPRLLQHLGSQWFKRTFLAVFTVLHGFCSHVQEFGFARRLHVGLEVSEACGIFRSCGGLWARLSSQDLEGSDLLRKVSCRCLPGLLHTHPKQ